MSVRKIWLVNFWEKLRGGEFWDGDVEEGDVLWRLIFERTSGVKNNLFQLLVTSMRPQLCVSSYKCAHNLPANLFAVQQ